MLDWLRNLLPSKPFVVGSTVQHVTGRNIATIERIDRHGNFHLIEHDGSPEHFVRPDVMRRNYVVA